MWISGTHGRRRPSCGAAARRSTKLANQVQRPNLVRLTKATLASTRCASPAVSRTRFASFSALGERAHSGIERAEALVALGVDSSPRVVRLDAARDANTGGDRLVRVG